MAARKIELSDKQMTFILIALDACVEVLEADGEDKGPRMADALYLENLARQLRAGALAVQE